MMVPKVDADGNELGGVPVVLREAPLGTYLGWNITNGGFHDGKICNYPGGWIPFAKTDAEQLPRRSAAVAAGAVRRPRGLRRRGAARRRRRRWPRASCCRPTPIAASPQAEASNVLNP